MSLNKGSRCWDIVTLAAPKSWVPRLCRMSPRISIRPVRSSDSGFRKLSGSPISWARSRTTYGRPGPARGTPAQLLCAGTLPRLPLAGRLPACWPQSSSDSQRAMSFLSGGLYLLCPKPSPQCTASEVAEWAEGGRLSPWQRLAAGHSLPPFTPLIRGEKSLATSATAEPQPQREAADRGFLPTHKGGQRH